MTFLAIYFDERRGGLHHLSKSHLVFILPDGCFLVGIVDIEVSNAPKLQVNLGNFEYGKVQKKK